jgi:WD40 repeat protein
MMDSAIQELSVSRKSRIGAAAFASDRVQIWDLASGVQLIDMVADYCMGAKALAIAPEGNLLATGYSKFVGKVSIYDVATGRLLWDDTVKYPSRLWFSHEGNVIWCTTDHRSLELRDAVTGSRLRTIKDTNRYFEGPNGCALKVSSAPQKRFAYLAVEDREIPLERTTFAVLDAAFAQTSFCFSEAGGPVRCFNLKGEEVWRFFQPGHHILRLHYSEKRDCFYGISFSYERRKPRELVRFTDGGQVEVICGFDSVYEAFIPQDDQLLTSSGEIRSLESGVVIRRLQFPRREDKDKAPKV